MSPHYEYLYATARKALVLAFGESRALAALTGLDKLPTEDQKAQFLSLVMEELYARIKNQEVSPLKKFLSYRHEPVTIRKFIEDPYFMDAKGIMYPEVMNCLEEMNNGEYQEAVLTGAIGTGKSTIALYSTAFQLYLLSCYKNPHELFGLDPSSEIVFVFQSINASLAKAVDYARFKAMIEKSPYFRDHFPFNKDIMSELQFPNRVIVKPVTGAETGAIGQNVIGGLIDEMNFMAVVEESKSSMDGGTYDQAIALYNSIARRRKSRFMKAGKLPGLLCLVSSKRYPGQFTDKKEEEARREIELTGRTGIYVYDKRTWDIKPPGSFSGKWFEIFIGDGGRKPRILAPEDRVEAEDEHLVMTIPEEYRMEFEKDMMNALRDIAGVSTLATHPFILDRDSITRNQRKERIIFGREVVDFIETQLTIDKSQFFQPELPRFVHIDLALTGDSAGFAVGTVKGFKNINQGDHYEMLPDIWIDALLEVKPPKGGEILFYKIRDVIYALKKLGMNIRWITLDQFQSRDSMQILRQQGYTVGYQSVDTTTAPYDFTKSALYENRLNMPVHGKCAFELASLEKKVKEKKIDHPPHACFVGETNVQCADGKVRTMEQLVHDYEVYGVEHGGVSWDVSTGKVVNLPMLKPHLTKHVIELVEIEMENGERFRCTPDHLYLLDSGEYKAAEDLVAGEELKS